MEIQNLDADSVSAGGRTFHPLPGRTHVFDVPVEVGQHLLSFPHHGWRLPELEQVPAPVVVPVPVLVVDGPTPAPEVVNVLTPQEQPPAQEPAAPAVQEPQDGPGGADPDIRGMQDFHAPDRPENHAAAPVEPAPSVAEPSPGDGDPAVVTVPDALVAMAAAAGAEGLTAAAAADAHGKQAYNLLGKLVEQGRLVKIGRGKYAHPDHAPA